MNLFRTIYVLTDYEDGKDVVKIEVSTGIDAMYPERIKVRLTYKEKSIVIDMDDIENDLYPKNPKQ